MFLKAEDGYEDQISHDATDSSYKEEKTFQQPLQILHSLVLNCHEGAANLSQLCSD